MPRDSQCTKQTVNVPNHLLAVWRTMAACRGVTQTEMLRTMICRMKFLDDEVAAGGCVLLERRDSKMLRQLVWDDISAIKEKGGD